MSMKSRLVYGLHRCGRRVRWSSSHAIPSGSGHRHPLRRWRLALRTVGDRRHRRTCDVSAARRGATTKGGSAPKQASVSPGSRVHRSAWARSTPGGFGYFARPKESWAEQTRLFRFDSDCRYRALQIGDSQWTAIQEYEWHGIPVHYCFYHPGSIPYQVTVPIQWPLAAAQHGVVSTRVMSATIVRASTTEFARNYAPSFADLAGSPMPPACVSQIIADEVLACNEGYIPIGEFYADAGVDQIFNRRAGPISSAIAIDIELPE